MFKNQNINIHKIQKSRCCVCYIFAYHTFDKQMEVHRKSFPCVMFTIVQTYKILLFFWSVMILSLLSAMLLIPSLNA
jgi:hypothetical protein